MNFFAAALEVDLGEVDPGKPVKLPAGAKYQTGPAEDLFKLSLSPDGQFTVTSGHDGKVKIWDVSNGKLLTTINACQAECHGADFSSDGKSLFTCGDDGAVHEWEISSGKEVRKFEGHDGQVGAVAHAPDGRRIASTDSTGIRVWDLKTGKQIHLMKGHKLPDIPGGISSPMAIDAIAFSADGRILLSEANDETARLWDTHAGRQIRMIPNHDGSTAAVALSANGEWAVSTRGSIGLGTPPRGRLWEPATGKIRRVLLGHQGDLTCVAFSPDSRYVLTGGQDRTLRQWEVDSGLEIRRFNLSSPPIAVNVSPNGKNAVTISISEGVVLWDIAGAPPALQKHDISSFDQAWERLGASAYESRTAAFNHYLSIPPADAVKDLIRRMQELMAKTRDEAQINKLILQLDDPNYPVRARAYDELEQLGAEARVALTAALENASPEVSVRAATLLNSLGGFIDARPVLATEILAQINTPEARTLLSAAAATQAAYAAHVRALLAKISK